MNSALDKVIEYIDYQQVELIAEAKQELSDLRTKVASLEARLAEALERNVNKWQPIDTAPKSRSILALDKIGEWMVSVEWDEHEDCWIDYEGQLYRDNYFDYWTENLPLPKPPEEK